MPRIPQLPLEELEGLDPDATGGNLVNQDVFRILAHRPQAAQSLFALINTLHSTGTMTRRMSELLRLRIAFHNQCRSCMSIRFSSGATDGVTDELVCSLERPEEAPDLTDAERAALHFADLFATNHLAIDDSVYAELRRHFDDGEIVEIGLHCALCVGTGRLAATWMVTDHVPEDFRKEGMVAPWNGAQLLVEEAETHL